MKQVYITFIALIFSVTLFAQGIAVQGIARDNDNSAISDETMVFTFSIVEANDTELYKEEKSIKTDNFGIFSHIVKNGTPQGGTVFTDVDFSKQGLKMKVSVNYNGTNIEVYDQPFQYTAYAHYARNGVPAGTVVAFMGDDDKIPTGWVKCTGQDITNGSQYAALRDVIGNTIPDLRARFLRGQGKSSNIDISIYDENTIVRQYLNQTISWHNHSFDVTKTTSSNGNHTHTIDYKRDNMSTSGGGTRVYADELDNSGEAYSTKIRTTTTNGNHSHSVRVDGNTSNINSLNNNGETVASRGEENRPWTVVVNYIIKL